MCAPRARIRNSQFFCNLTLNNAPDRQQCVQFSKIAKSGKFLHPTVLYRPVVGYAPPPRSWRPWREPRTWHVPRTSCIQCACAGQISTDKHLVHLDHRRRMETETKVKVVASFAFASFSIFLLWFGNTLAEYGPLVKDLNPKSSYSFKENLKITSPLKRWQNVKREKIHKNLNISVNFLTIRILIRFQMTWIFNLEIMHLAKRSKCWL